MPSRSRKPASPARSPSVEDISPREEILRVRADVPRLSVPEVFAHWTLPMFLSRWWAPESEIDLRPGAEYHVWWPENDRHLRGRYRRIEPPKLLEFTWSWDGETANPKEVLVEIFPGEGTGAEVIVEHRRYGSAAGERKLRASDLQSWMGLLSRLAALEPFEGF